MFFIRTDANKTIGTGHVMRCLSIADEICSRGEKVVFIIADEYSSDMITVKGYDYICLYSAWDDLEQEIDKVIATIKKHPNSTLLIDTYYVTVNYLNSLKPYIKTVYIDDLNKFIYPVDILINYNIYADELGYEERYEAAGLSTQFVLGGNYAPLRKEFSNIKVRINETPNNILISSGGTDNLNVVGNLLESISHKSWFLSKEFYVILGRFNVNKEKLEQIWGKYNNIHLLVNITNMSEYMEKCDVAITAGGVTTYELCASGIPSIMYTLADNQLQIARKVEQLKLFLYAGDIRYDMKKCMHNIIEELEILFNDIEYRRDVSKKMQQIIDGNGCKRLIDVLLQGKRWL